MALKLGSQLEQADLAKLAALARLVELPLPPLEEAVELALQLEPGLSLGQVEPPLLEEAGLAQRSGSSLLAHRMTGEYR